MKQQTRLSQGVRDALISAGIFLAATGVCALMAHIHDDNNPFAPQVFTLAVVLISYFTRSYVPGIVCSLLGVVCVNVLFTYPFYRMNFTATGYPLTFAVMLFVSVLVSALTTRVRREEQLRFEIEKEKLRAGLLRAASHDLRTPLTGIIGCSSAILEQDALSDAEVRALVREIRTSALWLRRVTENILSVTRFQEGVVLHTEPETVEEVLGSAIRKFRRNTGSTLSVTVGSDTEFLLVPMDGLLMEQVFINLLDNAARHAAGATRVAVTMARDRDRAVITFADDGCGIPPERRGTLFEPGAPSTSADGGMGIGLSVCRAIVEAHGGTIGLAASADGASFVIRLPLDTLEKEETE
ncbi:MAG: DUF4118 domain-containing protein [Oscillospiraceae bacterium]|nr:DUF4118 domain-containing protein [Oscillospiraceae bacterium]MBQ9046193.1 DUF4118 domain-containing protein [Oscillospiraceae bacterium]